MKLRTKLLLSFSCVVLLLLGLGAVSKHINDRVRDRLVEESRSSVQELELAGEVAIQLYRSMTNIQYLLEQRYRSSLDAGMVEDTVTLDRSRLNIEESLGRTEERLREFRDLLEEQSASGEDPLVSSAADSEPASLQTLETVTENYRTYASLVDQLLELSGESHADAREFFTITIEPYFRSNLLPRIAQLREQTRTGLDEEVTALNSRMARMSRWLVWGTLIALVLSLGLAWMLYRSIASPVGKLARAAEEVGRGNLDKRIDISSTDEIGQLGRSFNRMAENLSRTTVSKDYMDNIIESMVDALIVTDGEGKIQKVNSAAAEMLRVEKGEELVGKPVESLLADGEDADFFRTREGESRETCETEFRDSRGRSIPVSLSKALMRTPEGEARGLVCVASDISERKRAEQQVARSLKEKEILLSEIHHRVKNNLAVISGMLQMQMWQTENQTARDALMDSQLRVQSIALVHEKLYQSDNFSSVKFDTYASDLLRAIQSTYEERGREIELVMDFQPVVMNINQAIPCSLLLNELVVNAYRHAFPGRERGEIAVKVWKEEPMIHIRVSDNGIGLPEKFSVSGDETMGMTLLNTLVKQLDGEFQVQNGDGAIFEFSFRVEDVY